MADAAVKQAIHVMGMDASDYERGAKAVDQANQSLLQSTARVVESEERVTAATRTSADGFARLEARYDPLIRAETRRQAALEQANRYLAEGTVNQERYAAQIQRVNLFYDQQIATLSRGMAANANFGAAAAANTNVMGRFSNQIRQAGFQVGDFAVQMASGANPIVAFTQQGSQLIQMFGPLGAVLGAALSIVGAVAVGLFKMGKETEDATAKAREMERGLESLNGHLLTSAERADLNAAKTRGLALAYDQANLALKEKNATETEATRIETDRDAANLRRGRINAALDQSIGNPAGGRSAAQIRADEAAAAALEARNAQDEAEEQAFRNSIARSGRQRETDQKAEEERRKEIERGIKEEERLRKAAEDKRVADHGRAMAEIDRLDQDAREAGLKGEELLAVKREEAFEKYADLLERQVINEEEYARARMLIEERYEKDIQALRDRAAEEEARRQQQELDRQAARIERQSERVLEQISNSAGDILFDYLEGKTGSFWQTFLRLGKRAFADLVATTAVNALFGSTVRGAVAAAPGIFGISGSSAGAGGSAAGGGFGFSDLGSLFSIGNDRGLFGGAFGGITAAIDSFGAGALGLSSVAGGGNTLAGLAGVEAGAIDAGFIAGEGAAGLGGATLSGLLGGAGLGFGAGTLLNGLLGGNPTGGMIGSGVGAIGGAIIGSIVPGIGTILGGLLGGGGGGILGGLFGGGQGFSGGTARLGIDESGRLYNSGANGKNFDLGPVNAWADQFAATINQVFDTLGLKFGAPPTSYMTGHDFGQGAHVTTQTNIASLLSGGQVQSGLPALDALIAAHFKAEYDSPSGASADQLTADLASMVTAFKAIDALKNPANDFVDVLKQIADQFDPLIEAAKKWGAAAEDIGLLEQQRVKSVESARMTIAQPYNLGAASIVDFLNAQSLTANSNLSPLDRLAESQRQFGDVLGLVRGGDVNQLGNLTQSAGAVLGISRDLYGSTGQGAAMERWVRESLLSVAELFSSSDFQDKQIAAISQQTQVQADGFDRMVAELGRLRSEVSRLRAEMTVAA